eukprot:g10067.t1
MGIPGLLGALKSVTYPIHVSSYRGLTVGVDAYCWLHRGAFSCGTELCTGVATEKYVAFCMKRVNLLLHHGIQPIMVFDGASLPMKRNMNLERRRQRESAQSKGEAALAAGEAGAAAQHFSKAVGVSHDMAFQFMKALRQAGVQFIVAPYEADAQLAFLSRTRAVDVVLTEDSDCLPYGCRKVLFKMDNEGHGQEIQLRNLAANTPLSLCNWKNSMFLDLCLLVGCDYITAAIKGLGIATAHKLVDSHRSLDKIISAVNSSKFIVPKGYWEQYKRARVTFRHHIIYNPQTETTMHLMPLGDTAKQLANLHFLGTHLQPPVAQGVANGWLLPTSYLPYETSAPPEDSEKRPPTPLQEAKKPLPDSSVAHHPHPAPEASVDDTGIWHDTGNLDQLAEWVPWQKPAWGESGDEEKEADTRHGGGHRNTDSRHHPDQDELAFRGSGGAETRTDQVKAQQGGGALALMGEPYDADQAKFVPASAQEFNSTQVSRELETLQRRKRRLHPLGDPCYPGPPKKESQEAEADDVSSFFEALDAAFEQRDAANQWGAAAAVASFGWTRANKRHEGIATVAQAHARDRFLGRATFALERAGGVGVAAGSAHAGG